MAPWDRFALRAAQVPPLVWAAAMLIAVLTIGTRTVGMVAVIDAAAVSAPQAEVAVHDLETHRFVMTDLAGSPMLLVAAAAAVGTPLLLRRGQAAPTVSLADAGTKLTRIAFAVSVARGHRGVGRALAIWLGALVTSAFGLRRVLVGARLPTDVLAGWVVGGILGLCGWALVVRVAGPAACRRRPFRRRGLAVPDPPQPRGATRRRAERRPAKDGVE